MRLRALEIEQFRRFDAPVRVSGMADGLNLIVGPNEMGKSTLVAALRAALFERHRSAAELVRSFAPSRIEGAAPRVALTFELEGASHRIEKRFLRREMARLDLPDGGRLEGPEAEDALAELLGAGTAGRRGADAESQGVWSVLWVDQGHSFHLPELGASARTSLQACLEAEVEEIVGGAGAQAILAAVDAELAALVTPKTGKPRGDYRRVEAELAEAGERARTLERERAALEDEREALLRAQAEQRQLRAEGAERDDRAILQALRKERDQLLEREARLRQAATARELAEKAWLEAGSRQRRHAELTATVEEARSEVAKAEIEQAETGRASGAGREAEAQLRAQWEELERERRDNATRRRLLERLHAALVECHSRRSALEAQATEVELALEPRALDRVRIAGRRPAGSHGRIKIVDPLEIRIAGVGELVIRPSIPDRERWRRELAAAEERAIRALEELGLIEPREQAAPGDPQLDMFDPERRLPDPSVVEAGLADAARLLERLTEMSTAVRADLDGCLQAARDLATAEGRASARLEQARGSLRQLEADLETTGDATGLSAAVAAGQAELADATEALRSLQGDETGTTVEELDRRIAEREDAIEATQARLAELASTIQGLSSRIHVRAGEALDERLEEARRRHAELAREHDRYQREARVLRLLQTTLAEAEHEAKQRYLEPLLERLDPLLQALLPGAELSVDSSLHVRALQRVGPGEEPLDRLSQGTREQIAVLTRLAFALVLADRGRPAMVVLDDALVFADDQRIRRMFEILQRTAERIQILVLTCREQLFQDLPATRLHLEAVLDETATNTGDPTGTRGAA